MMTIENEKKDIMFSEAVQRLELMKVNTCDSQRVLLHKKLEFKIVVDHREKSVRREETTEEELQMIKNIENKYDIICYYLIQDNGIWLDGFEFPRYTLLYVSENTDEYEMIREECIKCCGTIPAYIINMEEREFSEFAEIEIYNVGGNLINIS